MDSRSVSAAYLDDVLTRVERDPANRLPLPELLARARRSDAGRAVKRDTTQSWRTGKTLPNGERVDEIADVARDRLLRVKLGVRELVEKLAALQDSAQNRNATLLWFAHAACRAFSIHARLAAVQAPRDDALRVLVDEQTLRMLLPPFTPDVTSADLPFQLRSQPPAVLIEVREGEERKGIVLVRLPHPGRHENEPEGSR